MNLNRKDAKVRIACFDISSIEETPQKDLLAQQLYRYLNEHYHHLRGPHRHSFHHLGYFTAGEGSFAIDFDKFRLEPFQVSFKIPGQAHKHVISLAPEEQVRVKDLFESNIRDAAVQLFSGLDRLRIKRIEFFSSLPRTIMKKKWITDRGKNIQFCKIFNNQ